MTPTAHKVDDPDVRPSAVDIFRERCEARAILVEACLLDLQDAVDGLQEAAEKTGLVKELGQDAVQRMMAEAFAIVLRIEVKTRKVEKRTAARSTLNSADYLVKLNDPACLKAWLAKHTRAERLAILKHIHGAKP